MPWIPQSLHDELCAVLRDLRAGVLVRKEAPRTITTVGDPHSPKLSFRESVERDKEMFAALSKKQETPTEPEPDALPPDVLNAAVMFGYGDSRQIAENQRFAARALGQGAKVDDVIRRIQDGEDL